MQGKAGIPHESSSITELEARVGNQRRHEGGTDLTAVGMPRKYKQRRRFELAGEQDILGMRQEHIRSITRHPLERTPDILPALVGIVDPHDPERTAPYLDDVVCVLEHLHAMLPQASKDMVDVVARRIEIRVMPPWKGEEISQADLEAIFGGMRPIELSAVIVIAQDGEDATWRPQRTQECQAYVDIGVRLNEVTSNTDQIGFERPDLIANAAK